MDKMNYKEEYKKLEKKINEKNSDNPNKKFTPANDEEIVNKPSEETKRNGDITRILKIYADSLDDKVKFNSIFKRIMAIGMLVIIGVFTLAIIIIILTAIFNLNSIASIATTIISSCVTYIVSLLSIFKIITKYVFNNNEDVNLKNLVDIILKNDLDNKKMRKNNKDLEA